MDTSRRSFLTVAGLAAGVPLATALVGCGQTQAGAGPTAPEPGTLSDAPRLLRLQVPDDSVAARLWPMPDGSVWSVWAAAQHLMGLRTTADGGSTAYPLGARGQAGASTAQVCRTSDGAIWVSNNYTIARLAPTAQRFDVLDLPHTVAGRLPGATDRSQPLTGSWVTSICPASADTIQVARLNVPRLHIVGPDLKPTQGMSLAAPFVGARAMAAGSSATWIAPGWLTFDAGPGVLARLSRGVATTLQPRGLRTPLEFTAAGAGFRTRSHSGTTLDPETLRAEQADIRDTFWQRWARSAAGHTAWVDRQAGAVTLRSTNGTSSSIPLARRTGPAAGPPGHRDAGLSSVEDVPDLCFAADSRHLWMIRDGGRQLVCCRL